MFIAIEAPPSRTRSLGARAFAQVTVSPMFRIMALTNPVIPTAPTSATSPCVKNHDLNFQSENIVGGDRTVKAFEC
jgi:hypothetical protein